MANPEQLTRLRSRIAEWNTWRADNPDGPVDLYKANLCGSDLSGANLRGADLYGANLSGADLSGSDLSGSDLRWADLSGADLSGSDLHGADLRWADLRGADLRGANTGLSIAAMDLREVHQYITEHPEKLDMRVWGSPDCGTAMCLAGHVVSMHPDGQLLYEQYGTSTAATLILHESGYANAHHYFFDSNSEVVEWLETL